MNSKNPVWVEKKFKQKVMNLLFFLKEDLALKEWF
jgi:hypothetical protein